MHLTAEMIKELRKELNDVEIDVSKSTGSKNNSGRLPVLKFEKENFNLTTWG